MMSNADRATTARAARLPRSPAEVLARPRRRPVQDRRGPDKIADQPGKRRIAKVVRRRRRRAPDATKENGPLVAAHLQPTSAATRAPDTRVAPPVARIRVEQFAKQRSATADPHRHGFLRDPVTSGDLSMRRAVDVVADDHVAGRSWQARERPLEPLVQLAASELVPRPAKHVGIEITDQDTVAAPPPRPAMADVARDRAQPAVGPTRLPEPVTMTPRLKQRLLRQVLGDRMITRDGPRRAEPTAGAPNQATLPHPASPSRSHIASRAREPTPFLCRSRHGYRPRPCQIRVRSR